MDCCCDACLMMLPRIRELERCRRCHVRSVSLESPLASADQRNAHAQTVERSPSCTLDRPSLILASATPSGGHFGTFVAALWTSCVRIAILAQMSVIARMCFSEVAMVALFQTTVWCRLRAALDFARCGVHADGRLLVRTVRPWWRWSVEGGV